MSDLDQLTRRHQWRRPAGRDLALWLVALAAPAAYAARALWAVRVVAAALIGRRRFPRG